MRKISDEMGKMREELRQREKKWSEEKKEMKEKIQGLEMRLQEMEGKLERKINEGGSLEEGRDFCVLSGRVLKGCGLSRITLNFMCAIGMWVIGK